MMKLFEVEPQKITMRALTWKDPYGTLMLHGKIETRTWYTSYRGLVLICVAKQPYGFQVVQNISGKHQHDRIFLELDGEFNGGNYGHAIAVSELTDCRRMTEADEDKCFVKYRSDLWCHVYENVRPIVPIPWKGKQGWSTVPDEIVNQIQYL